MRPKNNHVIEETEFIDIDGSTREIRALERKVDFHVGDVFATEGELMDFLADERQDLINYRVFDSVEISAINIREDDLSVYWNVTTKVVDSWTLVPIPYPKYSSNSGFRLALRTDYANAFGTMTDLNMNLGFNTQKNEVTNNWEITRWNITPQWSGVKLGDYWGMSVSANLSKGGDEFTSGSALTQYNYSYYQTGLGASFSRKIVGNLSYSVSTDFDFRFAYKDERNWGNFDEEPFNISLGNGLYLSSVDWRENFREGSSYGISHLIRYTFSTNANDRKVVNELNAYGIWYLLLDDIINLSTRLGSFYIFNDERSGSGGYVRGVADSSLSGETGVYLQNSLGFQFWRWEGVWDAQVHPFFDIALIGNVEDFDINNNLKYGAGVDLVLYLDVLPTLVARATVGFNLSDRELDGLGDKLEIEITSSLSY